MAKKQLTIEEKLQAALVPVEEQPYKVPENWCWTYLVAICEYMRAGGDKPKSMSAEKTIENYIPVVANGLQDDGIIGYTNVEKEKAGTLTVSGRGTIGHAVVRIYPYVPVVRLIVLSPNGAVSVSYLKYIFDCFEEEGTGSSIPQLTVPALKNKKIPLPPLAEQSRIVARIESLFAKLDEAKEKIQEVLDGADLRRAAILHQAFTGNLTEKWRKSHTVTCAKDLQTKALVAREGQPESWIRCKIGDYLELKAGKFISAAEINAEISDVTPYECFGGNGIRGYVKNYNTEGTHPLIGRQGALCGNVQVGEGKFYATEHAVVVTYKYDTDTMWIVELLRHMNLNQYSRSVAQPGLAVKNIVELPIVIAPYEEQVEIGRILDNLLSREQSTVTACEEALTTIDTLKKSILARAFRGELGTNDPAEPSAQGLLQEILEA